MFRYLFFMVLMTMTAKVIAADFTFKEKSPSDRRYNENYQGID